MLVQELNQFLNVDSFESIKDRYYKNRMLQNAVNMLNEINNDDWFAVESCIGKNAKSTVTRYLRMLYEEGLVRRKHSTRRQRGLPRVFYKKVNHEQG